MPPNSPARSRLHYVMKTQVTEKQVRAVCQKVESLGSRVHTIPGAQRTAIGMAGNQGNARTIARSCAKRRNLLC